MQNKKIILVERQAQERANLKKSLINSSFEVLDFSDSMSAIQWVMEHGNPKLLILEESSYPLNGWQTMDYMRTEIGMIHPTLIVVDSDTETTEKKLQGVIRKPYANGTPIEVEEFLKKVENVSEVEELAKPYSLEYLMNLSDGNWEFIMESLALFEISVLEKTTELQVALDQHRFDEVRKIAHSIKPSFQMLLNQAGEELCHTIEHSKIDEELTTLVQELRLEYELIQTQITLDHQTEKN